MIGLRAHQSCPHPHPPIVFVLKIVRRHSSLPKLTSITLNHPRLPSPESVVFLCTDTPWAWDCQRLGGEYGARSSCWWPRYTMVSEENDVWVQQVAIGRTVPPASTSSPTRAERLCRYAS